MIKLTKFLLPSTLAVLGLLTTSGCISSRETTYSDVTRITVSFANDKAGHIFYETLSLSPETRQKNEKHVAVNLILVSVEQNTVAGPNRNFNDAVVFCDTNHDGVITEVEADIFARAWPARKR